ncbi:MAG: GSCFA domain-containing protein [Flavobacteriaceae bacterium]|nr:GSCFA domain-containing protein [Flavobacteriaceae bacterium]
MTSFRTTIKLKKQTPNMDYDSRILLLGSCFTEHISQKLDYFKFETLTNPFGIVFNSSAIKTAVTECVNNKVYTETDLKKHNDLWHSFKHHSQFSSPDLTKTLSAINTSLNTANEFIKTASHIVITLGTSWVFTDNDTGKIVANCHKVAQKQFTKSLQSIAQIFDDLEAIELAIKSVNKKAQIIYTVSPVRHLHNGFTENMQSKAHLIAAVQKYVNKHESSYYFPAFEIMIDDLRDYRFYEADMIHPNSSAINYIWDLFKNSWLSDRVNEIMMTIDGIQKDLQHRPFNKNTQAHQKFTEHLNKKIAALTVIYPRIKF